MGIGLTSDELSYMRTAINDLLPDTCDILSVTNAPDGQGGVTATWGTAYASVSCRLDQKRAQEQVLGGAVRPYQYWMFTLPYDAKVTEANRIQHNGVLYAVKSVDGEKSWIASTRVQVDRV